MSQMSSDGKRGKGPSRQKAQWGESSEGEAFPEGGIPSAGTGDAHETRGTEAGHYRDEGQTWEPPNAIRRNFDFTWLAVGTYSRLSGEQRLPPALNLQVFSEPFP